MLKREMNETIILSLKDYFDSQGYKLKKTSDLINFRKKVNSGFQDIAISSLNYYHTHYLSFAYGKNVSVIEEIMLKLEKCFEPNFFYLGKDSLTYAFSPRRIINHKYEKTIEEKQDILDAAEDIKIFTEKYAYSLFDFLDDVK